MISLLLVEVKKRMEKDVNEVTKIARLAKSKVEQLNKDVSFLPSLHSNIWEVITWIINKLWLLIDFAIYLMLCWLSFSRMLWTEENQDLARDQVWTDPGQQPLCKVHVIISCLPLSSFSFLIWLIAWWFCCSALTKKLRERILEFQVPPLLLTSNSSSCA